MTGRAMLLGIALFATSVPCRAQSTPFTERFDYRARAADCPSRDETLDRLRARLGSLPSDGPSLSISVALEGATLVGRTMWTSAGESASDRVLRAPANACHWLVEALVAHAALVLESVPTDSTDVTTATRVDETGRAEIEDAGVPAVEPVEPTQANPSPPLGAQPGAEDTPALPLFDVAARARVGLGRVPVVGLGLELALVWHPLANLSLEASAVLDVAPSNASTNEVEVRAELAAARVSPCLEFEPIALCAVLEVGAFVGHGRRTSEVRDGAELFVAAGLRVAGRLRLTSAIALVAATELLTPLSAVRFVVEGQSVYESWPLAPAVALGVSLSP